jgi:Cu2+-containing amine oxidase
MDIRERYQKFVQQEIRENANPYPTGIQGFTAGVKSEFQRVIDILHDHVCPLCERGEYLHDSCEGLLSSIDLLRTESK